MDGWMEESGGGRITSIRCGKSFLQKSELANHEIRFHRNWCTLRLEVLATVSYFRLPKVFLLLFDHLFHRS